LKTILTRMRLRSFVKSVFADTPVHVLFSLETSLSAFAFQINVQRSRTHNLLLCFSLQLLLLLLLTNVKIVSMLLVLARGASLIACWTKLWKIWAMARWRTFY